LLCDGAQGASADIEASWALRQCQLLRGEPPLELWEGRFVFADGAGVRVWPTCGALAEYLRETGLGSDGPLAPEGGDAAIDSWRGTCVLELGSGCGALAVLLARWGCGRVVATDASLKALELAGANTRRHAPAESAAGGVEVRRLDWRDLDGCRALREELGPFQAVVASDVVLAALPVGAMWRRPGAEALAKGAASSPDSLLDAAKELAQGGAEVFLAVANRAGDARCVARALFERRDEIELLALPREMAASQGRPTVTIFHFKYREEPEAAGETQA